jgi:DNA repair exonuclease SbcCD ATPase subunit
MSFSFFRHFIGGQGDKIVDAVTIAAVRWDPKTASMAQLREMEDDYDKANGLLQQIRQETVNFDKEIAAEQREYEDRKAAAQLLLSKQNAETDEARKAAYEKSITAIVTDLEARKPRLEHDKDQAARMHAQLDTAQAAVEEKMTALTEAKAQLADAERQMKLNELEAQRAKAEAERAAQLEGLRGKNVSGLNTALDAMQGAADKAARQAEAARAKADALTHASKGPAADENVAAALAEVRTGTSANASISDRLAHL